MFRDHFHILVIVALCFGHFVNMAATPHVMPGIKNASNDGKNRNAILNGLCQSKSVCMNPPVL